MATGSQLWRPYSGFLGSIRKSLGPLLGHLTCGNAPYFLSPRFDSFIRYLFFTPSYAILTPLVVLLFLLDHVWLCIFWMRALNKRYNDFWLIERRIKLENLNKETFSRGISKGQWTYESPIADALFSYLISIMYFLQYYIPNTRHLYWHFATTSDMERAFREYLTRHPPAHPVTANDITFFADDPTSPFQVLVVNVCERLSSEEVHSRARQWAESDKKLQAVTSRLCGRPAWEPLPSRADLTDSQIDREYPLLRTFNLEDHIQTIPIDLARTDLNEYLSGLGSICLKRDQPLWKLFILQPTGPHPVDLRVKDETTNQMKNVEVPANHLTFLTFLVHHSLGDGAGMVSSVVEAFFDPLDHKLVLGTHAWRTSATFYFFSIIQSVKYTLSMLVFLLLWVPKPPTLLTKDGKLMERRPNTGRKTLPPPSIIELSEMRRVKKQLTHLMPDNRKMREPTINDIITYCLTSACYVLRHSSFAQIRKIALRGDQELPAPLHSTRHPYPTSDATADIRYHHRYASHFEDYMQLCLPMSVRTGLPTGLDNFTSVVLTRLPMPCLVGGVSEREKTLAALKAVVDELNFMKRTNHRGLFFSVIYAMYSTLPTWLVNLICEQCALMCQIILTNVRASETELTFCGKKVLAIHSWAPGHEAITTAVKLLTYKGDLQILVTIDDIEWMSILSEEEYLSLSQKDKIALSSALPKLIVEEFQKLRVIVDSS